MHSLHSTVVYEMKPHLFLNSSSNRKAVDGGRMIIAAKEVMNTSRNQTFRGC